MSSGELVVDLFSPTATLPELEVTSHEVRSRPPLGHATHSLSVSVAGSDDDDYAGHAGGDDGLMASFVAALGAGTVGSGELSFATALDSHLMAFAAEQSRLTREPINFGDWVSARGPAPSRAVAGAG